MIIPKTNTQNLSGSKRTFFLKAQSRLSEYSGFHQQKTPPFLKFNGEMVYYPKKS